MHLKLKPKSKSSLDRKENYTIYSKSYNSTFMIDNDTDEIIQELLDSLLPKYQIVLEQSTKGSNSLFIEHMCKNGSKVKVNPKNNDDKCSRYAITSTKSQVNQEILKKWQTFISS